MLPIPQQRSLAVILSSVVSVFAYVTYVPSTHAGRTPQPTVHQNVSPCSMHLPPASRRDTIRQQHVQFNYDLINLSKES
jgi:hypothetical protein